MPWAWAAAFEGFSSTLFVHFSKRFVQLQQARKCRKFSLVLDDVHSGVRAGACACACWVSATPCHAFDMLYGPPWKCSHSCSCSEACPVGDFVEHFNHESSFLALFDDTFTVPLLLNETQALTERLCPFIICSRGYPGTHAQISHQGNNVPPPPPRRWLAPSR